MEGATRKGERTRRMIVEKAAPVFNTRGYFGTSISDLARETGLEKGGIYNHFDSKEQLACVAFDFGAELVLGRIERALEGEGGPLKRLVAGVKVHRTLAEDRPIQGGCPLLNTAVESDDAQPVLKERAQRALARWQDALVRTILDGIDTGDLEPETDPEALASLIISSLEGSVMMSKLYGDPAHVLRAVAHLSRHLGSLARR